MSLRQRSFAVALLCASAACAPAPPPAPMAQAGGPRVEPLVQRPALPEPGGPGLPGDTLSALVDGVPRVVGPPMVMVVGGLKVPESALHDAEQDVYFISVVNGPSAEKDNNGSIARVHPMTGQVDTAWVTAGRGGAVLNGPKGLALTGDTLWVADIDAVRAFHRRTGAPLASIDLRGQGAAFLNDLAVGSDGALYVTDTGTRYDARGLPTAGPTQVFRISGGTGTVYLQAGKGLNGIAWDARGGRWLLADFGGTEIWSVTPGQAPALFAKGPGQWDGIVVADDRVLVSSQASNAIHTFALDGSGGGKLVENVTGVGDIGWDAARRRLLVPRLGAGRVEIYQLPAR